VVIDQCLKLQQKRKILHKIRIYKIWLTSTENEVQLSLKDERKQKQQINQSINNGEK
jgi:hypothetical protein